MFRETKSRSVAKTITWRVLATITTFTLVYIFTGEFETALTVGFLEVFLKMLFYFLHERGWDKLKYGRHEIQPFVLWFTGLSGSGKNDLSRESFERLKSMGLKVDRLDGHKVRHFFPETGFARNEVNEHIKRIGYLANKLEDNGVIVVASFLSPFAESREEVRKLCKNFNEIFVDSPLATCIEKDVDGIYTRFKNGEIKNLPGMDVPYDEPRKPALVLKPGEESKEEMVEKVIQLAEKYI